MNPRRELFCYYYIEDGNATKSAIRAGYSKRSARQQGQVLLQKHDIIEKINEIKKSIIDKHRITIDDVIQQLAYIAFSDLNDVLYIKDGFPHFRPGGNVDLIDQIKMISSKKIFKSGYSLKSSFSINRRDRVKALSELARILRYHEEPVGKLKMGNVVVNHLFEKMEEYISQKKTK